MGPFLFHIPGPSPLHSQVQETADSHDSMLLELPGVTFF